MTFRQFIIIPLFIAFQAFVMMLITPYVPGNPLAIGGAGLLTWVAFQAWAVYFLAGFAPWNDQEKGPCLKMGLKSLLGYLGGIGCSITIFELNKVFACLNSSTSWGLYISVFIAVIVVISFEKVPGFNFIPTWFIGAGVFFALMTLAGNFRPANMNDYSWYAHLALAELVACAVGLLFGGVTVIFRGRYEAQFNQTT